MLRTSSGCDIHRLAISTTRGGEQLAKNNGEKNSRLDNFGHATFRGIFGIQDAIAESQWDTTRRTSQISGSNGRLGQLAKRRMWVETYFQFIEFLSKCT